MQHDSCDLSCLENVFYDTLLCSAVRSAEMDKGLRDAILASTVSDRALKAVESVIFNDPFTRSLVGTTRAVDIVGGGVKACVGKRRQVGLLNEC